MRKDTHSARKPSIIISDSDYERLTRLATNALGSMAEVAEELLAELERAKVVDDKAVPANVVRMGSTVTYRADNGQERTVTLVNPGEADIAEGKISIMTPIGTALIGLAEGKSIGWLGRDGHKHRLTVLSVGQH
ncbi:nucleoside diphosphate kinase regulator [Rhodoligotrophos defluvii]|uniref:nucleoside diphosphate kinase regulator n=1 Tax=Rhodoligotrophos defluvii TaxID=2561934 RepID=UPI0010C9C8D2|nr:nucleoside diphosphate kinase regulator [Rhodoligotrophos defluvii]